MYSDFDLETRSLATGRLIIDYTEQPLLCHYSDLSCFFVHVEPHSSWSRRWGARLNLRHIMNPLNTMKPKNGWVMISTKPELKVLISPFDLGDVSNTVKCIDPMSLFDWWRIWLRVSAGPLCLHMCTLLPSFRLGSLSFHLLPWDRLMKVLEWNKALDELGVGSLAACLLCPLIRDVSQGCDI